MAEYFTKPPLNGDLGEALSETYFGTLGPGTYNVIGNMSSLDQDFFSFSVASGNQFDDLILRVWDTSSTSTDFKIRIAESLSLGWGSSEYFLGNHLYIDSDLIELASLGPFGSGGFSAGTRTGTGIVSYEFEIAVSSSVVPLPAAAWLFGSALLGLGVLKRRKA